MTRRVRASACLLAWSLAAGSARAQDRPLTTADVVQRALERNRDLLAARQRVAEAQGLLRQAGVRVAPTVEIEAATGRPLGSRGEEEYSAGYFYPIETAGKRSKRIAVGRQGVALAEAEVADRTRQLVFEVKMQIAELRAARRKAGAVARLVNASQESYKLTQARVAAGDAAALEQRLLESEVRRVEAQKATFTGRLASAVLDLRRLVGAPLNDTFAAADEPSPEPHLSMEQLKALATRVRPQLVAARAEEEHSVAEAALARAEGTPDLTASVKYTHLNSQLEGLYGFDASGALTPLRDRDNIVTVGLSIPIFTAGRNRGNIEAVTSRAVAARLRREYLETAVPQEVEAAYLRWSAAKETLALFERGIVDQSERNLDVMRQAYTLGQLRLLDILNEQRRLIDTELAYIDAQTELAEAAADLERTVGADLP